MNFGPPPMNFQLNPMSQQGQDGCTGQFGQFGPFGQPGQFGYMPGNQETQCQIVCKDSGSDQTSERSDKEEATTTQPPKWQHKDK